MRTTLAALSAAAVLISGCVTGTVDDQQIEEPGTDGGAFAPASKRDAGETNADTAVVAEPNLEPTSEPEPAADSSVVEPATPDATPDTRTADSGTDTRVADSGTDTRVADSGAADSTAPEASAPDVGMVDAGAPPSLTWRKANLTTFTSYPEPGSEECIKYNGCTWAGQFAALSSKQPESWVRAHNIAAVHGKDFATYKLKTLRVRQGTKQIDVKVYDMCADSDCSGCCTANQKGTGFLIDLEKSTVERFGTSSGTVEWTCLDC